MTTTRSYLFAGALVASFALGCGDSSGSAPPAGSGAGASSAGMGAAAGTNAGTGASAMGGGGGTGAGTGGGSSATLDLPAGIAPDTQVTSLTEADALALCDAINMQLDAIVSAEDVQQVGCTLFALLFSLDPASGAVDPVTCASMRDACVADPSAGPLMSSSECHPEAATTLPDRCDVTIGEYAECLAAGIALFDSFLDSFTCETLTDPNVAAQALAVPDPSEVPACATIQQTCPELLSSG